MPLFGKEWLLIDGGCGGEAGGVICEDFGPSERLNGNETKAALIAADAVRNGNGAMIDAKGEALEIDSTHFEAHWTLEEVLKNETGAMTPIEGFISKMLDLYRAKQLDAEFILEEAKDLQKEALAMDRDLAIVAKRYRKQLDEAIASVEAEAHLERKGPQGQPGATGQRRSESEAS